MGIRHLFRTIVGALAIAAIAAGSAMAQDSSCPLPGQKPTLVVQLFFGQSVKNRGPVTRNEWNSFLKRTVTPRFPDGLTVYDGYGQWLDPETHRVIREKSKTIVIATADTAPVRASIAEVSDTYCKLFDQQSVAIVTYSGCSAF